MIEIKKFWNVKSHNYNKINEISGSKFTDKEISDIKINHPHELTLVMLFEDEEIFMIFPETTDAIDYLIKNDYIYKGELSIKEMRKDKLNKLFYEKIINEQN